jgi:hypothetical protein
MINISVIMYGGLSYGGAHKQIIRLICLLDKKEFNVTYFWCNPGRDIGSTFNWPDMDYSNITKMEKCGITVIQFSARGRDIRSRYHRWLDTDFMEKFNSVSTDIIFTAKSGHPEYPFILMNKPIVEYNIFGLHDSTPALVFSALSSDWVHKIWLSKCRKKRGKVIYPGVPEPTKNGNMRETLGINVSTVMLGFHQRADDNIYGEHALRAAALAKKSLQQDIGVIVMGGSDKYKVLARTLGLNVVFVPVTKEWHDISSFLSTLDIYIHSGGAGETLCIAIQEAMIHKLPVITMEIPGKANGQIGTLAGCGMVTRDIDEYADAIRLLADDLDGRRALGKSARDYAAANYGLNTWVKEFESIFRTVHCERKSKSCSFGLLGRALLAIESIPGYLHCLDKARKAKNKIRVRRDKEK